MNTELFLLIVGICLVVLTIFLVALILLTMKTIAEFREGMEKVNNIADTTEEVVNGFVNVTNMLSSPIAGMAKGLFNRGRKRRKSSDQ